MKIKIFDVEHGFCSYIVADNGNVILVDCGHNNTTGFRPSSYLCQSGCTGIERFIVSNYDEDHLSDLPNLRRRLPIGILHRNKSINLVALRELKRHGGPLGPGIESLLEMAEKYVNDVKDPPEFPQTELHIYWNDYPDFTDTNNLSLVTFLDYRDIHIIFPGDLEITGWDSLMQDSSFRERLRKTNFFIASHHGRESGYCKEVFDYCQPLLIIISDDSIQYDPQNVDYR